MAAGVAQSISPSLEVTADGFLAIMPCIDRHARIYFRYLICSHQRDDARAEAVALAWKWYVGLVRRGKDPSLFPSTLARFAARAVRCGRKLCSQERPRDVLSSLAQMKGRFTTSTLRDDDPFSDALRDNTQTPVPDQVAFRLDFPLWRLKHSERERRIMDRLMEGAAGFELAADFGVSCARISQLRREMRDDWMQFCDDTAAS